MKRETGTERSEPEAARPEIGRHGDQLIPEAARPEIGRRRDQIDWSAATAA
jgi:hypothetical protein